MSGSTRSSSKIIDNHDGQMPRRREIRYDQFVKKRRRIWPLVALAFLGLGAAGGGAYYYMAVDHEVHTPPPALSSAGGPVAGEAYQWNHVAVGAGGFITGLSMDPSGKTFVVRTDVYGAYIWSPQADRWIQLVNAPSMPAADRTQGGLAAGAYEIAVAPSRPDRIYMAIKGNVYRSDDRGAHWALASAGNPFPLTWDANSAFRLGGPYLSVSPENPDLVFLGTPGDGLWRSPNGGVTWQHVASVASSVDSDPSPGVQAPGIIVWFEQPAGKAKFTGRIFAMSSGHGMTVSEDGGVNFRPLPAVGTQPMALRRGAFDTKGTFYGVDDITKLAWAYYGDRWHNLTQEAGLPVAPWAVVASNPRASQTVIFDQGGEGYQTVDGGKNWTHVSHSGAAGPGDPPWLRFADSAYFAMGDIHFDPNVPNRLWVAGGMGVFYADFAPGTSVANWVSQSRGIEELVANDIIQAPGQSPIFAGWDFGLHVKDNLNAYSSTFGPNERSLMSVQQIDWSPANPAFVVTNASDARMGCCAEDGNAVMAGYSTDGGRRWKKFGSLPTPAGQKDDYPWRMSFGTIAVSSGDVDNIVWEPAFNRTPFYTTDRGKSWKPVVLEGQRGDKTGSFEQMYYQRKTLTADKSDPGVFYLYHSGEAPNLALLGLWRSRDGGASWQHVYVGEIAPASNMAAKLRSVPGHAGHLFFTSAFLHTTDTVLRRSTDGGVTWNLVPHVEHVDDIAFGRAAPGKTYPTIFISGRVFGVYGVWRSLDNAASWQQIAEFPVGTLDQVTVVAADPDVFGRVYLGYSGSGWIWGEPAPCKAGALAAGSTCFVLR